MEQPHLTWITNFIWGIADDVLRDLYVRGKYRDVILPMTVIRRLDAVLEPTKKAVLDMKATLDEAGIANQDHALRQAAGQAFYNTSPFTLRDLRARANQQQLKADFEAYLDGFSPNVQEILDNFEYRNQIPRLSKADRLGTLLKKLLDPSINLSPEPVHETDGSVRISGLDNHAMGTIFEELIRRFNEENNEEAGEHWTPCDTEQIPLLEEGGIEAFIRREVLPYAPDAWFDESSVKIGYEISFNRYFYKPQPMRTLEEIRADILAVRKESEGLLDEILGGSGQ